MQSATKKSREKRKRNPAVVLLILLIIAALTAGVYFGVFLFKLRRSGIIEPRFGGIPTDATGNNLVGNIPENLAAGGFMASQDGWFYFANFADGASLYMCRDNGENMVRLTGFPVANINVIADSVVFTSLEKCVASRPDGVDNIAFDDVRDLLRDIAYAEHAVYGGRLYAINGLRSGGRPELTVIDGEHVYFSPVLTRNGLYAIREGSSPDSEIHAVSAGKTAFALAPVPLSAASEAKAFAEDFFDDEVLQPLEELEKYAGHGAEPKFREAPPASYEIYGGGGSIVTEKMSALANPVARDDEIIVRQYVYGSAMLAELRGTGGGARPSRILRIDLDSMQPTGEITGGKYLYKSDNGYIFQNSDGFVYELRENGDIKPVSAIPVLDLSMTQDGRIIASVASGQYMLMSREQLYNPIFVLIGKSVPFFDVKLQNGWYNYINPEGRLLFEPPPPGFFLANGRYYRLFPDGTWLHGNAETGWLNRAPSLSAVAGQDDFSPSAVYDAPWFRPGGENDTDESGEIGPFSADGQLDATESPETSLDAAIMLLVGDSFAGVQYSAESIAKLRAYYGDNLELSKAADMGAEKVAEVFAAQFGAEPDKTGLADVLKDWITKARYRAHDARITGDTAEVTLTVTNTVNAQALTSALQSEISRNLARNPLIMISPKERQAQWAMEIFMQIAKNPEQYNAGNAAIATSVKMKQIPGIGWVLENPDELTGFFNHQIG